jgi:FMN phosphatase YigB (HAD superfamily)
LWQWDGEAEEILDMWFEAESEPNKELLETVQLLRGQGVPLYLVSQQEKYRASYLHDVVFANKIDGTFFTCDIGFGKNEGSYWEAVIFELKNKYPEITAKEIIYFDDRISLVEKAKEFSISSYLYKNNDEVKKLLV